MQCDRVSYLCVGSIAYHLYKHNALIQCWFKVGPALQTMGQNWLVLSGVCMWLSHISLQSSLSSLRLSQKTRDVYPMLFQCWPVVVDGGPTLDQY